MNLDLLWAVQLVTIANPVLAGRATISSAEDAVRADVAMKVMRLEPRDLPDAPRVANVIDWMKLLHANQVPSIALSYSRQSPQSELLGPVIHVVRPNECQMWQVDVEADEEPDASGRMQNRGVLRLFGPRLGSWFSPHSVDEALDHFRTAVLSARRYSFAALDGAFSDMFDAALKELDATRLTPAARRAMPLSANYATPVRNLAAALSVGWVFGGMGSWNDIQGDEEYASLTDRLWSSVADAVEAVGSAVPN